MSFFNDLPQFQFLQFAVIAAVLCSIVSGLIGSFVVIRRSTYVTGAVAHSALGGIGIARYFQVTFDWRWFSPMLGAVLSALIASAAIAMVRSKASEREDTILSVIWASGMAVGITFLSMTPGYAQDMMGYLFGDILLVNSWDLVTMVGLMLLIIGFVSWKFDRLLAVSFNPQLAELRGANPLLLEAFFTIATAMTVVVLVRLVGIVMVIALLTLPAATAARLSQSLPRTILLSIGISIFSMLTGIWISYEFNLPTGATIIEIAAAIYLIVLLLKRK